VAASAVSVFTPTVASNEREEPERRLRDGKVGEVIRLHRRGNRLSATVRDAPWKRLLEAVERETGIAVEAKGTLEGTVTSEFSALHVENGLRRLFRDADVVVFYAAESNGDTRNMVTRVWLFPRSGPGLAHEEVRHGRSQPAVADERKSLDDNDGAEEQQRQELAAFLRMTKDADPTIRRQALSALSDSGHEDMSLVESMLRAALADQDAGVRGYAIETLASRGGPEAVAYLWEGLRDQEPSVRIQAIESVDPRRHGLAVLQAALEDPDETVRSIATFRLKQAASQEPSEKVRRAESTHEQSAGLVRE
jgi:hypothetical protein